jgi:hypothetical protein
MNSRIPFPQFFLIHDSTYIILIALIVPDLVGENLSNLAFIFLCHLLSNFLLSDIAKFPVLPCAYKFQPLDISWWG